jgi:hypothetical protein
MEVKELWLLNTTSADVSLGDLGVKILANKTTNVYAYNPYLTEEQVKKSMSVGSLQKRIISGALKVVKTDSKKRSTVVDKIKESKQPVLARKTKSSIVVEHTETEAVEGKGFEFADYGLGELESEADKKNLVVVKSKQDELPVETTDTETVPKAGNSVSTQSAVIMDTQQKGMNSPVGKLADTTTNGRQPYVVTKSPAGEPEVKQEVKVTLPKITKAGETILVEQEQPTRNIKDIAKTEAAAPDIDAKVATKTDKGAIVMELKEVPKKEEKPKKVKKSKPTS